MTVVDPGVGSPLQPADDPGPRLPAVRAHRSWLVALSAGWLALVVLAAVLAPVLPLTDYGQVAGPPRGKPELSLDGLLGYDVLGRSMLSRIVSGAQASLLVGVVSGLIAFVVGSFLGLLAGFLRGVVDTVISFVTDTLLAFPPLVMLLALASVLRPSIGTLIVSLSLLMTPTFARLARANTMRWASREFVMAATNMGAGLPRLMGREVLPNVLPSVAAYLPVVIAALIVAEGSLSFLGLGVPAPTPSWGGMINDGQDLISRFPNLVFVPAATILLTVLALNIVGDRLRVRFGERTR
ncbi:ABC transporter permease [Blastococcus sp. TF02A-26]|uniref:ABC transporter permease n=1 Tax=Blastococcus sp. TF02A-26 TaxID=2250577 RepID=UPI000DE8D26E|nr:ABC transporter permease [Blastococcus sp. TF02A-26]RBY86995.1 ABC transporter permease [Blastococcus sp. TF02A-26]